MIVVATALIGPTESAPQARVGIPGTRFVCYTDRDVPGWDDLMPAPPGSPRQAARRAKMAVVEDFADEQWSIWIDASFDLTADPREIMQAAALTDCPVAGFRHPDRNRISDEAREVIRLGLAPKDKVDRQIEAYRIAGFDTDDRQQTSLTTTGLLVRRHTDEVRAFTGRWREEIERHTLRDQLSVDYAAWRTGVTIGYLPGHYRDNRFARYNRERHKQGRVTA
jgi:hypothetical protein